MSRGMKRMHHSLHSVRKWFIYNNSLEWTNIYSTCVLGEILTGHSASAYVNTVSVWMNNPINLILFLFSQNHLFTWCKYLKQCEWYKRSPMSVRYSHGVRKKKEIEWWVTVTWVCCMRRKKLHEMLLLESSEMTGDENTSRWAGHLFIVVDKTIASCVSVIRAEAIRCMQMNCRCTRGDLLSRLTPTCTLVVIT